MMRRLATAASLTAALLVSYANTQAQEPTYADVSQKQLDDIRHQLSCSNAASPAAKVGCDILREFAAAGPPEARLLKESTGLSGRRWLGITVVIGEANAKRKEVPRPSPYFNLITLGARYSDNFHQKTWYENGYAPTYIWPTHSDDITVIEQAAQELLANRMDRTNAAVQFASETDLEFVPVKPSAGKSLLLDNEETFLRQSGDALYLVEIWTMTGVKPKYCLSRIAIRHAL